MRFRFFVIAAIAALLAIGCLQCARTMLVRGGSAELERAISRSRETLGGFRARLDRPLGYDQAFFLRSRIREGRVSEVLWLRGVRAKPGGFTGAIDEKPCRLPTIRKGTEVSVDDSDVVDWAILRTDGSREGAFTAGLEPGH